MDPDSSANDAIDALREELGSRIDSQTEQLAGKLESELRLQTGILADKLDTIGNAVIAGAMIIIGSLIVLIPMIYRKLEVFVE